jgi:hypothetical protein
MGFALPRAPAAAAAGEPAVLRGCGAAACAADRGDGVDGVPGRLRAAPKAEPSAVRGADPAVRGGAGVLQVLAAAVLDAGLHRDRAWLAGAAHGDPAPTSRGRAHSAGHLVFHVRVCPLPDGHSPAAPDLGPARPRSAAPAQAARACAGPATFCCSRCSFRRCWRDRSSASRALAAASRRPERTSRRG